MDSDASRFFLPGKVSKVRQFSRKHSYSILHFAPLNMQETERGVLEIITLLMTSCYVILQTYNARRQAEIQHPLIGITEEFFRCKDKKFNWYQACFYNEKNGERRWYTTNNGSTKAIKCLIKLKQAWGAVDVDGLFNVPSFRIERRVIGRRGIENRLDFDLNCTVY